MSETKLENFKNALARFNESIEDFKDKRGDKYESTFRDSLIKRYEITFELGWKALADFLVSERVKLENRAPKTVLRAAHVNGYINDEKLWLDILEIRNLTVHTYGEEFVKEFTEIIIKTYAPALNSLLTMFEK